MSTASALGRSRLAADGGAGGLPGHDRPGMPASLSCVSMRARRSMAASPFESTRFMQSALKEFREAGRGLSGYNDFGRPPAALARNGPDVPDAIRGHGAKFPSLDDKRARGPPRRRARPEPHHCGGARRGVSRLRERLQDGLERGSRRLVLRADDGVIGGLMIDPAILPRQPAGLD